MKKILLMAIAVFFFALTSNAQTMSPASGHDWKPEFTARYTAGYITGGPSVTAGIKKNDLTTVGVWIGHGETYIDAAPGDIYAVQTAAYLRRYLHLDRRHIFSLYGELVGGCEWIYDVTGKYRLYEDPVTGVISSECVIQENKGDAGLYAGVNAGFRLRIVKNIHLFFGPTYTSNTIGFHLGLGF